MNATTTTASRWIRDKNADRGDVWFDSTWTGQGEVKIYKFQDKWVRALIVDGVYVGYTATFHSTLKAAKEFDWPIQF